MSLRCRVSRVLAYIRGGTYAYCVACDEWHHRIEDQPIAAPHCDLC